MIHLGAGIYTATREVRETRAGAVEVRARAVITDYVRHARERDQRHHGISSAAVRAGTIPPGPILTLLQTYDPVVGLVFGCAGEMSRGLRVLLGEASRRAARDWEATGARTYQDARGAIAHQFRRRWGIIAARSHARLLLARLRCVGLTADEVRSLRADAGRPMGRRAPDEVTHGADVEQLDMHYGAWLSDYADVGDYEA